MKTIDARGLSCPEPVIMLRKALSGGEPCQMIVDNHAAKENTSRYGMLMCDKVTHRNTIDSSSLFRPNK